ncbi:hypothetical protein MBANPS3_001041 [Mucor bainieri]
MGMPCAHFLKNLLLRNLQIAEHDFHPQQRLYYEPVIHPLPEDILPLEPFNDNGVLTEEGNELDAMAKEDYSRQIFEAEERERLRGNSDQYRDQRRPLFRPEITERLNARMSQLAPHQSIIVRQMVRDLMRGQLPFELQNPSQFTPRGRLTAAMANAAAGNISRASQRGRGGRRGGRSQSSTQRDPSGFEYHTQESEGGGAGSQRSTNPRRCTNCRLTGNSSRTCCPNLRPQETQKEDTDGSQPVDD